jgi:hypothetical protein
MTELDIEDSWVQAASVDNILQGNIVGPVANTGRTSGGFWDSPESAFMVAGAAILAILILIRKRK